MRKQFPPNTTCPSCGSDRKTVIPYGKYEDGYATEYKCTCGFVFDFSKAIEDAIERFPIVHDKLGPE